MDKISGFIFMCNSNTKPECFQYRVFGLPLGKWNVVDKIKPGVKLFLFDFEIKRLYGIYEAASIGQVNLEPAAFEGKFPAQVKFRIFAECLPLPESFLRNVIKENYQGSKFNEVLNGKQVNDLMSAFHPLNIAPQYLPRALLNVSPSLEIPRSQTENQFRRASQLLAPEYPYVPRLPYNHAPPLMQPRIISNFLHRNEQRTTAYVDPLLPTLDGQVLPLARNYHVTDANQLYFTGNLTMLQDPYSRYNSMQHETTQYVRGDGHGIASTSYAPTIMQPLDSNTQHYIPTWMSHNVQPQDSDGILLHSIPTSQHTDSTWMSQH